jgi:hypothetical protein
MTPEPPRHRFTMKPLRHLPLLFPRCLFALSFAMLVLSAAARAQETICYALMKVPKLEAPIVRFEMAEAKADHFAYGQDFFASTRGARRLVYFGKLDMAGQQRGELKQSLPPSLAFNGPWDKTATRASIAAVKHGEGHQALLGVDATFAFRAGNPDIAAIQGGATGGFHRYTTNSQVLLRPNAWQEIAFWSIDHYCLMLWQYPLIKDKPKDNAIANAIANAAAAGANAGEAEEVPLFRLEMTISVLPEETLARLDTCDAGRRRLIAESYQMVSSQWSSFSLHCLPGQPFSCSTARGLNRKRSEEGYLASSTCRFTGTLGLKLGTIALKSEFRTPAPEEKDRLVIPIAADLVPGEWHIQRITEEPLIYDVGHECRMAYEEINPQGGPQRTPVRANAAIYRVVEIKR